jgi:hypothetical protein
VQLAIEQKDARDQGVEQLESRDGLRLHLELSGHATGPLGLRKAGYTPRLPRRRMIELLVLR